jgi:hypothetical protein
MNTFCQDHQDTTADSAIADYHFRGGEVSHRLELSAEDSAEISALSAVSA